VLVATALGVEVQGMGAATRTGCSGVAATRTDQRLLVLPWTLKGDQKCKPSKDDQLAYLNTVGPVQISVPQYQIKLAIKLAYLNTVGLSRSTRVSVV
jgi:hypothetical protein